MTGRALAGGVVLAMLAAFPAASALGASTQPQSEPQSQSEPQPRPVVSEILGETDDIARDHIGTVAARIEADLGFPLSGTLADRRVETGDTVRVGDVLARLDPETLEAEVQAARAGVIMARYRLRSAQDALSRARTLFQRGNESKARLEAAERAHSAARARLEQAEAALARAQDRLDAATLRAPHDGVIIEVMADPGAGVRVGQPVVRLAATREREVVADLSEAALAALPREARLRAHLVVADDRQAPVSLRSVDPVADSSTRTRRVHFALHDAPPDFRLGALVRVEMPRTGKTALTLPAAAVFEGARGPSVWVVSGAERVVRAVPVSLGERLDGRVPILAGLEAGQEVVVKGVHSLTEGQSVGPRLAPRLAGGE